MSRNHAIAAGLIVALVVASAIDANAADWRGAMLPNAPTQFIFGYGSLINTSSRNSTAGVTTPAIRVRVSAARGYIRAWNDRSPAGFTALGLRKPEAGESATTINGVLYPVEGDDMSKYDGREKDYARVEVPREDIQAISWQGLPQRGQFWVYVPAHPGSQPGIGLQKADAAHPMLESNIDVMIEGGLEYGPDFARETIETTADWSQYWLNDRELARRPWVHDAKYNIVDKMLGSIAPANSDLSNRLFSEPYAVRWRDKVQ